MADEYKAVLSGGLSLKGGLLKKKKKRKLKSEPIATESTRSGDDGTGEDSTETSGGDDIGKKGQEKVTEEVDETLTLSQRRFKEKQLQRESKKIRNMAIKTHRERVEEFNALLASITEHNDIPRCSAAGNG